MRKTTLLCSVLAVSAAMLCFARPVRDDLAAKETSYTLDPEPEPRNTDYIQVDPTFTEDFVTQNTKVYVGYDTDFYVGTRIVIDITVLEWNIASTTTFAVERNGGGFSWLKLYPSENLPVGRHIVEFTIQNSNGETYAVKIDDGYSVSRYTNFWGNNKTTNLFYIGNANNKWGSYFRGLYHGIKLYDSYGNLRHSWVPDPSGKFYDEIEDTFTTISVGRFIYGDLANE